MGRVLSLLPVFSLCCPFWWKRNCVGWLNIYFYSKHRNTDLEKIHIHLCDNVFLVNSTYSFQNATDLINCEYVRNPWETWRKGKAPLILVLMCGCYTHTETVNFLHSIAFWAIVASGRAGCTFESGVNLWVLHTHTRTHAESAFCTAKWVTHAGPAWHVAEGVHTCSHSMLPTFSGSFPASCLPFTIILNCPPAECWGRSEEMNITARFSPCLQGLMLPLPWLCPWVECCIRMYLVYLHFGLSRSRVLSVKSLMLHRTASWHIVGLQ